jgi:hypothetical protein
MCPTTPPTLVARSDQELREHLGHADWAASLQPILVDAPRGTLGGFIVPSTFTGFPDVLQDMVERPVRVGIRVTPSNVSVIPFIHIM